jgi:hypothetical protein
MRFVKMGIAGPQWAFLEFGKIFFKIAFPNFKLTPENFCKLCITAFFESRIRGLPLTE